MATYTDKIQEFKRRLSDISAQLISLKDRRKEYSFAASEGNRDAIKQVADADFQSDGLQKQVQTLQSAIETAEALEKQQTLDHEQQLQRERDQDAYSHARAIIALNCEVDDALLHLRELFERRASLLNGLAKLEVVDPAFVARMQSRSVLTRASCAHGLHRFLSLETPAPASMVALATTNETLLGVGTPPSDDKSRVKFRGNGS
jgi:hypothetical protein